MSAIEILETCGQINHEEHNEKKELLKPGACPRGVMVKTMDCGIVVSEFIPQSRYYVHFRTNTIGKAMTPPPYPPSYGLKCTTTFLLEE